MRFGSSENCDLIIAIIQFPDTPSSGMKKTKNKLLVSLLLTEMKLDAILWRWKTNFTCICNFVSILTDRKWSFPERQNWTKTRGPHECAADEHWGFIDRNSENAIETIKSSLANVMWPSRSQRSTAKELKYPEQLESWKFDRQELVDLPHNKRISMGPRFLHFPLATF